MKTVLIVEDNEINMRLFDDLLQANGYNIIKSYNGQDTECLVREHRPDIIVMDGKLGEYCNPDNSAWLPGHCGLHIARKLKENKKLCHIPIIVSSACDCVGFDDKLKWSDCEAFVAKPINVQYFLATVKKCSE